MSTHTELTSLLIIHGVDESVAEEVADQILVKHLLEVAEWVRTGYDGPSMTMAGHKVAPLESVAMYLLGVDERGA